MRRGGYLLVTLLVCVAGAVAAIVGGHPALAVVTGAGVAWMVQAVSFWLLAGGLERGEVVTRMWVAGIAGRFGAGILLWVLAALAGAPTQALMIAYGMALVAFVLLEAGWLTVVTAHRRTTGR